jgi:hypothetical protein
VSNLTTLERLEQSQDLLFPCQTEGLFGDQVPDGKKLQTLREQYNSRPVQLSNQIVTPVWTRPLSFIAGGVLKYRGPMKSGKTRIMIAHIFQLVMNLRYRGDQIFANFWIDIPGAHWLSNDELKKLLRRAFNTQCGEGRWNHCIFALSEADDLYSHITQSDTQCFQDIQRASQACKRNQYLLYEIHDGLGVPKFMRDKTEISIKPLYLEEKMDCLHFLICNGSYESILVDEVRPISWVNNKYHRFDEMW